MAMLTLSQSGLGFRAFYIRLLQRKIQKSKAFLLDKRCFILWDCVLRQVITEERPFYVGYFLKISLISTILKNEDENEDAKC